MVVHMLSLITRLLYSLKGIQGRRNMGGRGDICVTFVTYDTNINYRVSVKIEQL